MKKSVIVRYAICALSAALAALAFTLSRLSGGDGQGPAAASDSRSTSDHIVDLSKIDYPELPAGIDMASAGLFLRTGNIAAPVARLGSGFLAYDRMMDRFMIITAAHVLEETDIAHILAAIHTRDDAGAASIWLINAETIDFAAPDVKHDVAVCDITEAAKQLMARGLRPVCLDLSAFAAGHYDLFSSEYCVNNVYVDMSGHPFIPQVGLDTGTRAACLDIADQTNGTFTTLHKDGVLIEKSVWKDFAIGDKPVYLGGKKMYIEVHELMGELVHGDSGAPVFGKDANGAIRLLGIVAGGGDGQKCYIVPAKHVHGAVYPALTEIDARIITDDSQLVKAAEYESTVANGAVETSIRCDIPLARKAVLTFEGDCAEGNGLTVNLLNSKAPVFDGGNRVRGLLVGWNNTDPGEHPPAASGHKRLAITFWLDRSGGCRKAEFSDPDGIDENAPAEERTADQYSPGWDKMVLAAYGEPSPNGKVKLELYATRPRRIEGL